MNGEKELGSPVETGEIVEVGKEEQTRKAKEARKSRETQEAQEVSRKTAVAADQTQVVEPVKDPITTEIENILAGDLTDMFLKMPADKQTAFKRAGEETASKIKDIMDQGKFKARKVVDLIKNWLRMIPGVNKFFLEQEAKIKTDKIMLMAEQKKNRQDMEV